MSEAKMYLAFLGIAAYVGPALSSCYVFWMIGQCLIGGLTWSKGMTAFLTASVIIHAYATVLLYEHVTIMPFLLRSWGVGLLAAAGFTIWHRFEDRKFGRRQQ